MTNKKQSAKEIFEELKSQGVVLYDIEAYKLKPYWDMDETQEKIYNFGLNSSIEELKEFFKASDQTDKIFQYVFKGVIASGDLEKFMSAIGFAPFEYIREVLSDIIHVSNDRNVKEETTLAMIKTILQDVPKEHSKKVFK